MKRARSPGPAGTGLADPDRRLVLRAGAGAMIVASLGVASRLAGRDDALDDPAAEFALAVESPLYDQSFAVWTEPSLGPGDVLDVRARAGFPIDVAVISASPRPIRAPCARTRRRFRRGSA